MSDPHRLRHCLAALLIAGLSSAAAAQTATKPDVTPGRTSSEPTGSCSFKPPGRATPVCVNRLSQAACQAAGMEAGTKAEWRTGASCP